MAEFDRDYWEQHWDPTRSRSKHQMPVNPYLPAQTAHLRPGTALDAGCGTGAEAIWLAENGWQVTAADISRRALETARTRAATTDAGRPIDWVEADLSRWQPGRTWDLVVTNYAHPAIGQLPFYRRIAAWVAPGGTLLIVGHLHAHQHGDHHTHPENASVTSEAVTGLFDAQSWRIVTAYEHTRTVHHGGAEVHLRDMIVRARRTA